MRHSDITGLKLLKSNIVNGISGLTMALCLAGAIANRDNDVNKSAFLLVAGIQAAMFVTTLNDLERNELTHYDVLDIESQATVNQLTERLVYGKRDLSPQVWSLINRQLEYGIPVEDIYLCLSNDENEAKSLLIDLERKYSRVR